MRYESHKFKDLTIRNFNAITELLLITILLVVVVGDYSSETTKININFIVPKKKESIDETYHGRKRVHKKRASKMHTVHIIIIIAHRWLAWKFN